MIQWINKNTEYSIILKAIKSEHYTAKGINNYEGLYIFEKKVFIYMFNLIHHWWMSYDTTYIQVNGRVLWTTVRNNFRKFYNN